MNTFIIREVRLDGWKPQGDVVEVDANTPLQWIIDCINNRGKSSGNDLKVIIMAHGLPGYVQCAQGSTRHPTAGNGLTITDLPMFGKICGSLKRLELYSCLVARIGACHEAISAGHPVGYDGNHFCYRLAQTIGAEVKASIHLQYFYDGTVGAWIFRRPDGKGINFGEWNGRVFTWDSSGKIIQTEDFPYKD